MEPPNSHSILRVRRAPSVNVSVLQRVKLDIFEHADLFHLSTRIPTRREGAPESTGQTYIHGVPLLTLERDLNKHGRPTRRAELVLDIILAKLVGFEKIEALMKSDVFARWVDEQVAVLQADGAVAPSDLLRVQGGDVDGVFHRPAMAVAVVGLGRFGRGLKHCVLEFNNAFQIVVSILGFIWWCLFVRSVTPFMLLT